MAGNAAHAGMGIAPAGPRPKRSWTRRLRVNLIQHLITYAVWATYVGAGIAVAATNGYLDRLSSVREVATAAGAVLLWPLVFL